MSDQLEHFVEERVSALDAARQAQGVHWPAWADTNTLKRLVLASDFAWDLLCRNPADLALADRSTALDWNGPESGSGANEVMAAMRIMRRRECLRLLLRDVLARDGVEQTVAASSQLAERCLDIALHQAEAELMGRHGVARDSQGERVGLVILGLGKLGGNELNFSSDIDLIFAFSNAGQTDGPRPLANEDYFARIGQRVIHLVGAQTAEGFCHRVDMRLRPFGQAGRLALSFSAMEQYYQRDGRDWERYAWVKARPVAGDRVAGDVLIRSLRPFVYRRYLDFASFESFRDMKGRIDSEVKRKGLGEHIKLGPGGIREIEFIVQLEQLIRGGREPELREHSLLPALAALGRIGRLDSAQTERLREAYLFLRRLENRLQMLRDEQVHELPEDPFLQQRLAGSFGYPGWPTLHNELAPHRDAVRRLFAEVFTGPSRGDGDAAQSSEINQLWQAAQDRDLDQLRAHSAGFEDGDALRQALFGLLDSPAVRALSARSRSRFERVIPALLQSCSQQANPQQVLERMLRLAAVIARRSNYLALLDEHPGALERVVAFCGTSAWIAETLIVAPLLLDDLLDPRLLDREPLQDRVSRELDRRRDSGDDIGWDMEIVRQVQQSARFRLALQRLESLVDAVSVAADLAALTDLLLAEVLRLAERDLARQYGFPTGRSDSGMMMLGYGSLGGHELNFGSDLDLVFLYPSGLGEGQTDGPRPVEHSRYFVRLAQRVVSLLTTRTSTGALFEVDVRLRPNGNAGLLVTSSEAFARYQHEQAWTWEHQALVRARPVVADEAMRREFATLRAEILQRTRPVQQLREDVAAMRQRFRQESDRSTASSLDLKQGIGALVDLEFMVQALVLEHAGAYPQLCVSTSTVEIITALTDADLLEREQAELLRSAHDGLLQRAQACTLAGRPRIEPLDEHLSEWRDTITTHWQRVFC